MVEQSKFSFAKVLDIDLVTYAKEDVNFSNYVGEPRWDTWVPLAPKCVTKLRCKMSFIVVYEHINDVSTNMVKDATAMSFVILPLTFIFGTIRPELPSI